MKKAIDLLFASPIILFACGEFLIKAAFWIFVVIGAWKGWTR
jgi:hypothetical protein